MMPENGTFNASAGTVYFLVTCSRHYGLKKEKIYVVAGS